MAATKKIFAFYSSKLNSMADNIGQFLSKDLDFTTRNRTYKGIEDFYYKNSLGFKKEFLAHIGITTIKKYELPITKASVLNKFSNELVSKKGECIFLLKDTYETMKIYQAQTGKGLGMLINREFLCRSEEDYFTLIGLIYDAIPKSNNQKDFLNNYYSHFIKLIRSDKHFLNKSNIIYDYVNSHQLNNIIWVDLGFQYTFSLFCQAAVRYHSNDKIKQDFYSFTVYPWLRNLFNGKYFSEKNELVLNHELDSIKSYGVSLRNKAAGGIVGFAIGDALGYSAAGIEKNDLSNFIKLPIQSFTSNAKHPYFSHLRGGFYTDNTKSLILSAENIIRNKGFNIEAYEKQLISWGKQLIKKPSGARWTGPTLMASIRKLIAGENYRHAGSTTTQSCSSTYRVIPLGIFYRTLKDNSKHLIDLARTSGMITHNSELSKTGAAITALIISDLMNGVLPRTAVIGAINSISENKENKLLLDNIRESVAISKSKTVEYARKRFGTGSPIYQTLPLAIFCFLKYQNDFKTGVLAAANSFREDTPEEKLRLKGLSWDQQLLEAKGGNVDGIAGLAGAFLGAHLGLAKIPKAFLKVEDKDRLIKLGYKLIQ